MIEITEKQLKMNEKSYLDRVEQGEPILLAKEDGSKVLMVPQNPQRISGIFGIMMTEHK